MELARAGVAQPFEWSAYDLNAALFVAMKVYNVTTGTPVLVATVGMVHVLNGTYWGAFTPLASSSYVINLQPYTDDTYVTPNLNYSPGSESLYAEVAPTGGGGSGGGAGVPVAMFVQPEVLVATFVQPPVAAANFVAP